MIMALAQALVLFACLGQLHTVIAVYRHLPFFGVDFKDAYLVQAHMLADGAYGALYHPQANLAWQEAHGFRGTFSEIPYPPLVGALLSIYLDVTVPEAVDAWFWTNLRIALLLGAALGLWLGWKDSGNTRLVWALAGSACFVLSAPVLACLIYGQGGLVLCALSLGYCFFYVRGRSLAAAACLAPAISLKIYPAALLLPALARRDWKLLGATMAGFFLWTCSVSLSLGSAWWGVTREFYFGLLPHLSDTAVLTDQSLRGVLSRWLGAPGAWLSTFLSLAVITLTIRTSRSAETPRQRSLALALAIFVQCLCIGRSWAHYHVILWPALVLIGRSQADLATNVFFAQFLLMMPIALWECDVAPSGMEWRLSSAKTGIYCLLMFAQWAICIWELRRQQKT